jgi:hypothetical protein
MSLDEIPKNIQPEIPTNHNINNRPPISKWFIVPIVSTFIWIFVGVSAIIGVRMFWNAPIDPSFALFGVVAFSAIVAFSIVLTLDFVTGSNLSFKFAGLEFSGTSGPVTLWILAFSAVMAAFILGGFPDLVKFKCSS